MKLSIVLVYYHTPDLLAEAVGSLHEDLQKSKIQGEILVVDNGQDPTLPELAAALEFTHLQPAQNLGYGGGLNLGVAASCGEFLFLMNADVIILPGATCALLDALDRFDIAGPRLFWDRGRRFALPPNEAMTRLAETIRKAGQLGRPFDAWARIHWRRHARKHLLADSPLESRDLSGAFLATRRHVWEKVGPFDSDFFLYFEETDWLRRAHTKGCRSCLIPAAAAIHLHRQSRAPQSFSERVFAESYQRHARLYHPGWFRFLLRIPTPRISPLADFSTPLDKMTPRLTLTGCGRPRWVEVSSRPEGYPAACELLASDQEAWELPAEILARLAPGKYWIRLVGSSLRSELALYSFEHRTCHT